MKGVRVNDTETYQLKDGRSLNTAVLTCPIPISEQMTLIQLWQTEWDHTDLDWMQSMNGAYSETLKIQSVIGRIGDSPAGTATVYYPCKDPEVCVVGSVLTHPDFRSLGIAARLVEEVLELAFAAGCRVSFLGTTPNPKSVYLRCGFQWHNGGVMWRAASGFSDCESQFFAAGQNTSIREAMWGDLPATSCFVSQPLDCLVIDYPRCLLSGKYVELRRCVSNFPIVRDNVTERGGAMCMLIGESAHRVLGFGTLTPGPATEQRHKAVIDVTVHDNYEACVPDMLEWLRDAATRHKIEKVQAYVAQPDEKKRRWFQNIGLSPIASLPGQLSVNGEMTDVTVLEGNP